MKPVQPASRSYAAASGAPSSSARRALEVGNIMSGVTVAQTRRSTSFASTWAWASAARAAGSARSVSACSGAAIRRSRMPVRAMIHSSDVSTMVESSSFVSTRSGTCAPRPVIEIGSPRALPIIGRLASLGEPPGSPLTPSTCPLRGRTRCVSSFNRERQRCTTRKLVADAGLRLSPPDRPPHPLQLTAQLEHVTGLDHALEPAVVDAGEQRQLAAVLLLAQHCDGTGLRERLDDQHARHHGPRGKVAGEIPLVLTHGLARDRAG